MKFRTGLLVPRFLLARLYTDSLLDKRTPKEVRSTLASFSKGSTALDNAYSGAIQRIEGQLSGDLQRAKKVLCWITYAKRPLNTAEMCCALAVEPGEVELAPENVPEIEDLVSVCAGLVVVDPESNIIRLVHYTAQEYFERIRKDWNPSALLEITSTCLTYLCFDAFKCGSSTTDEEFEDRLRQNKFLDYAAKHWGEHAVAVEDKVYEQVCSFLLHEGLISCATQVLLAPAYKHEGYSQQYPKNTTGLHLTAQLGLSLISEKVLLCQVHDLTIALASKDSYLQTPLYLAALYGNFGMAKLLLDKGSDVNTLNTQNGHGLTALWIASSRGHEQIVRLLLDNGADVNAVCGQWGTALQVASSSGHDQIVRLLLDNGADVNAQDDRWPTALYVASERGHDQIVRLLLDHGADVNARGGDTGSALGAACDRGHIGVVKLLLEAGSNPKSLDCAYGSPLHLLACNGHTDILRLIYDRCYETPLLLDSHGRTPLQLAARGGHFNAFQYLLSVGFDPAITDGKGENLLHYASSGGSMEILNAVLHMDCVFHTQSEHWSPIHWACRNGNPHLVERLIEEGIHSDSVTIPEPEGQWSPISIAIFHGNEKMLEALSEHCMSLLDKGKDAVRLSGKRYEGYWCDSCFYVSENLDKT